MSIPSIRGRGRGTKVLTEEEIPDSTQLDRVRKLGMPQHFPVDAVFANVMLVDRDFFGPWVNLDDAGREAFLELFSEVRGDGFRDFDVREETIGCGG
jgi:hypothetical protein